MIQRTGLEGLAHVSCEMHYEATFSLRDTSVGSELEKRRVGGNELSVKQRGGEKCHVAHEQSLAVLKRGHGSEPIAAYIVSIAIPKAGNLPTKWVLSAPTPDFLYSGVRNGK